MSKSLKFIIVFLVAIFTIFNCSYTFAAVNMNTSSTNTNTSNTNSSNTNTSNTSNTSNKSTSSTSTTNSSTLSSTVTTSDFDLELTNILCIVLIVVGVLLILLGIAILIRLKR